MYNNYYKNKKNCFLYILKHFSLLWSLIFGLFKVLKEKISSGIIE